MLGKNKLALFEKQAFIMKAIAHPLRIAIADFLRDGEQCVCDIAEYVGSERSNVSKHLSIMEKVGILDSRKEGLNVIYSLKCPCVLDFLSCSTNVLKQQIKEHKELLRIL